MMLSYEQLYREVQFYKSIADGKLPERVWVYILEDNHAWTQIKVGDFPLYEFVGYTYPISFYPVVSRKPKQ
jgi:hypothetical protein